MKPTQKIIELSKRLKKLGYIHPRKMLNDDEWRIYKYGERETVELKGLAFNAIERCCGEYIFIPSLEDGLEWLEKQAWDIELTIRIVPVRLRFVLDKTNGVVVNIINIIQIFLAISFFVFKVVLIPKK